MEKGKKSYLITGGAGFIGSHLVDHFLENGGEVSVYDNLSSGSFENIKKHSGNPDFKFIEADLLDFETLERSAPGKDEVWHFGANTNIVKGMEITDCDLNNSTIATKNVLEAMRRSGSKKIFFPSSSTVYGESFSGALSEGCGPLLPISLYGAGKLACEGMISAYSHLFGIQGRIFRLANIVGARMEHGVILNFIRSFKKDPGRLEILGNGEQRKSFLLVDDCIEGMVRVSESSNAGCDVYNLGSEGQTSLNRIAAIVAEEMGIKDFKIKYSGGDRGWKGDVPAYSFDLAKIKSTGWLPRHGSDESVRIAAKKILEEEG
ncbi:MAG: NAD-dependent epimerase/dehydratase family protein [Candidatus Paceibacterota bacterium]|jgi:UDP-glucose 4-epimerase